MVTNNKSEFYNVLMSPILSEYDRIKTNNQNMLKVTMLTNAHMGQGGNHHNKYFTLTRKGQVVHYDTSKEMVFCVS